MTDHPEIYRSQAEQYEALVSREDYQSNILPSLQKITPLAGKTVVELGAGTGRLTCQLAPIVRSIHAFDQSQHMLDVAIAKLKQSGLTNWSAGVSDHRQVNEQSGIADVIISGWSVCYIVVDSPETWEEELDKVFTEMRRILKPGGMILLLETLGTGFTQPEPPPHLLEYYQYLDDQDFKREWIRTDYQFEDMEKAESLSSFFFGKEMCAKIERGKQGILLPECTGIWWKRIH